MKKTLFVLMVGLIIVFSCGDETVITDPVDLIALDDTPYEFSYGAFPAPDLPLDNLLTQQGVQLGKMLFYEKKLSKDGSQSCASCHDQNNAFTDTLRFSIGVKGLPGTRQAMSVFNMAWNTNGFFWDGRADLLRHQSLLPIQDALEMDETLENVISKLSTDKIYQDQFTRAFGTSEITEEKLALAMEQFMLSIVSVDSKYDKYLSGATALSESEERGRQLYFAEFNPFFPDDSGADCEHCHGGINFENDQFMNNGLDDDTNLQDLGREIVTELETDKGKFKVPSLRNIAMTPPYMHDGRFQTLEEVLDHYDHGIKKSSTIDPALIQVADSPNGLALTDENKQDLINFLHTLTDDTFLNNPEYENPF